MNLNKLAAIDGRRQRSIDNVVGGFERDLHQLLSRAKARTLTRAIAEGSARRGHADISVLRRLDEIWRQEHLQAGSDRLLRETVDQFQSQFGFFEDVLKLLKIQPPRWDDLDQAIFQQSRIATVEALHTTLELAGQLAKQRAMFAVGDLKLADLSEMLARQYDLAGPRAVVIADTSMSTFYRVIADRGYQQIQADHGSALRYRYYGPDDKITRPFCQRLLALKDPLTRAEIDKLDNGQLPNVFQTCGGYSCRHQWLIDVS